MEQLEATLHHPVEHSSSGAVSSLAVQQLLRQIAAAKAVCAAYDAAQEGRRRQAGQLVWRNSDGNCDMHQ